MLVSSHFQMSSLYQMTFAMLPIGVENVIDEVKRIGDAKGVVALGEHGVDNFPRKNVLV